MLQAVSAVNFAPPPEILPPDPPGFEVIHQRHGYQQAVA